MKFNKIIILFFILATILGSGCQRKNAAQAFSDEMKKTHNLFSKEKMLHIQQVVEYYDASGNPIPRYFELFVANEKMTGYELDSNGNVIQVYQSIKNRHISYDMETLKAREYPANPMITLDLKKASEQKGITIVQGEAYRYCNRPCRVYGITNGNEEDDIRLYIDDETGYVLFCDSPLFCIKTASIEILPLDSGYFEIPEDLIYEE